MSQDTLKKLVAALVVALGLWGVVALFSGPGAPPGASPDLIDFFATVDSGASIESIRFTEPDGAPTELAPLGGGWTVNGFDSDSGTVARLLSVLADAEVGDLVARNVSNHARMGVAEEDARTLEVAVGGAASSILIGNSGPRYGTTYVRVPGAAEVYLLDGDLGAHARRRLDDWRSKRIVAVDTAAVARLDVQRDDDAYSVIRADSAWTFEDGSAVNEATVRDLLRELRDLRAAGFLHEGDSLAAAPAGASIVAASADGAVLATVALGSGDSERWARAEGDSITFRLTSFRVDRLVPNRDRMEPSG